MKKILSIDGGGVFGLIPATLFKECSPYAIFDVFGGTSIGSVIAAYYACGLNVSDLPNLMMDAFPEIFNAPWYRNINPRCSKYPNDSLKSFLSKVFGNKTLGSVHKPLFIVSFNMSKSRIKVYTSTGNQDSDILVADALLDSVSAPTYFPPTPLVDGGLCANNPSVVIASGTTNVFNIEMEDISVFSVGTGFFTNTDIDMSGASSWSTLEWASPIIKAMLAATITTNEYIASELPLKAYCRWNKVPLESEWAMDNPGYLKDIIAQTLPYQGDFDGNLSNWLKQAIS